MTSTFHTAQFRTNAEAAVRRTVFQGRDHLVVPVVMIVEGVLNDALLLTEEFGIFPQSWDGCPVPVQHPSVDGIPVSANRPDVFEFANVGHIFNTHVQEKSLCAEIWLDIHKAEVLGHGDMVTALSQGAVLEVSTGYYAFDELANGLYGDVPYSVIHRQIRPDHLALLPGNVGACSVEDGCGTRTNEGKGLLMRANEAWRTISAALRLSTNSNCTCEDHMTGKELLVRAQALVKTNALDAKQLASIQKMTPEDRDVMAAFIAALGASGVDPADMVEEPDAQPAAEDPAANGGDYEDKTMTKNSRATTAAALDPAQLAALVANAVKDQLARERVVTELRSNARNTLSETQLATMGLAELTAVAAMIRPADYSGAAGFAANGAAQQGTVTPLLPRGVLKSVKKEA